MALETARLAVVKIRQHLDANDKKDCSIIFHGGEPLLLGAEYLDALLSEISNGFSGSGIHVSLGMQSNGTLFSKAIGEVLLRHQMSIGISVDGPAEINDLHRVDKRGRGSSATLERSLDLLLSERYRTLFSGFLSVINTEADPVQVIEYGRRYRAPEIDFLLPYDNHDRLPPGKLCLEQPSVYASWLIRAFEYWFENCSEIRVQQFDSIMKSLVGGRSTVESIGLGPVDLIVIETDGSIEAVDSLKATFEGATVLGYHIERDTFCKVASDLRVSIRSMGSQSLCQACVNCDVVNVCGGGYLPNRYSEVNGFDNPSVYCSDLKAFIRHVERRIRSELTAFRHTMREVPVPPTII